MPTMEEILAAMVDFRDATYSKLDAIQATVNQLSAKENLIERCPQCAGIGTVPISDGAGGTGTKVCSRCAGVGTLTFGKVQA